MRSSEGFIRSSQGVYDYEGFQKCDAIWFDVLGSLDRPRKREKQDDSVLILISSHVSFIRKWSDDTNEISDKKTFSNVNNQLIDIIMKVTASKFTVSPFHFSKSWLQIEAFQACYRSFHLLHHFLSF